MPSTTTPRDRAIATLDALRAGALNLRRLREAEPHGWGDPSHALAYLAGWIAADAPDLAAAFIEFASPAPLNRNDQTR